MRKDLSAHGASRGCALGRARVRVKGGAVDPALLDTILTHLRRR